MASTRQFYKVHPSNPRVSLAEKRGSCGRTPGRAAAATQAVVNPMFGVVSPETCIPPHYNSPSDLEMDVLTMSVPGRLDQGNKLTRTEEVSILKTCKWDLEPKQAAPAALSTRQASTHFPLSLVVLLAIMFVMCGASVVMSMLAMLEKIGCGGCSCPCGELYQSVFRQIIPRHAPVRRFSDSVSTSDDY